MSLVGPRPWKKVLCKYNSIQKDIKFPGITGLAQINKGID